MKKLITILTLSLTILTTSLIPSIIIASQIPTQTTSTYQMITRVSNVQLQDHAYQTIMIDENENTWEIYLTESLSGEWLNCYVSDNATPYIIEDDIIYDIEILAD